MLIPIHISVRGVIFASLIVLTIGIFVLTNNSKEKDEYEKTSGFIEYFEKEFENLPNRHKGDYRYLKVNTYPYLFEIYEPNSAETERMIDDLKVGDEIDVYFYETADTRSIGLNRFVQFIDKEKQPYFIRSGFQKQLGYVLIALSALMNLMAFAFWKKGSLNW